MATSSVKLDQDQNVVTEVADSATKKVSGFTDSMSPVISSLKVNPQGFVAAGLASNESFSNVLSPYTDLSTGSVVISDRFFGGEAALPTSWTDAINPAIEGTRTSLSSLKSLLGAVKVLLDALKALNLASDDILYALIRGVIKSITTMADALIPQMGVHQLVIPPHIPSVSILDTKIDEGFKEKYEAYLKFNEEEIFGGIAGSNQGYVTDDLTYTPKQLPTADSAESLRSLIIQSLNDKYDYMRPFHSPGLAAASNSGHSAGIILTAGGPLSQVLEAYRTWETFIDGLKDKEKVSDSVFTPRITDSSYLGLDSAGDHKVSMSFTLAGHSYDPSFRYEYFPVDYTITASYVALGSLTPAEVLKNISNGRADLGYGVGDTRSFFSSTPEGYLFGKYFIYSDQIEFPFTDYTSSSNKVIHNYLSRKTYTEQFTLTKEKTFPVGATVNVLVSVTYTNASGDVQQVYSSSNILLSKPSRYEVSASKSVAPNWQGASAGLKPLESVSDYLTSLTISLQSLFERGVVNPLDASLEIVQDYLTQLDAIITTLDRLVATFSVLANFRLGGFGTVYSADKGLRGVDKAVNAHFDELKNRGVTWAGQSTTAIVLLAQSDTFQDLQTFIAMLELLFGAAKKEEPIGSAVDSTIVAEAPIVTQAVLPLTETPEFQTFDSSMSPVGCGSSPEDF
jgi:hypothetical protein